MGDNSMSNNGNNGRDDDFDYVAWGKEMNQWCDTELEKLNQREKKIIGAVSISSLTSKSLAVYRSGLERGDSTGWRCVDEYYTVKRGEMTIVTGIPGSGKTTWLDALMINLAKNHDWRFAMFSAENLPFERHVSTFAEQITGKPFRDGPTERMSETLFMSACDWLNDHLSFIDPEEDRDTVQGILESAEHIDDERKIDGLIIDPWNEISHSRDKSMSETDYISIMLTKIRRFARDKNIHVWVVAHPAKMYKGTDGKYPIPSGYDISGSANWKNKADNSITVSRNFSLQNGLIEVHVQKIRFREVGKIGMAELYFNRINCKYYETEHDCRMMG